MNLIHKLATSSLIILFTTCAFATDVVDTEITETESIEEISISSETTPVISERKSCETIASEIAELSAIEEPDSETLATLEELKQKQRSICNKDAGARTSRSTTKMRSRAQNSPSRIRPTKTEDEQTKSAPVPSSDSTCQTPDENGCCPGEKYTDMGELGFNCCPETGGECFPPILVSDISESTESTESAESMDSTESDTTEQKPSSTEETVTPDEPDKNKEIAENIAAGLCADGSKPNKFGCCNDEVFKEVENMIFACCPPDGGDCFPPIK